MTSRNSRGLHFELTVVKPDGIRRSYRLQNAVEVGELASNCEAEFARNPAAFDPDDIFDTSVGSKSTKFS